MVPRGASPAISLPSYFLHPSYEVLTAMLDRFPGPADECEQQVCTARCPCCLLPPPLPPPTFLLFHSLPRKVKEYGVQCHIQPQSTTTQFHKNQSMPEKRIATLVLASSPDLSEPLWQGCIRHCPSILTSEGKPQPFFLKPSHDTLASFPPKPLLSLGTSDWGQLSTNLCPGQWAVLPPSLRLKSQINAHTH